MEKYLTGIHWDPFEGITGIYVTGHHIKGWRYFSTYKNGEAKKPKIFQKLNAGGMSESPGEWDWHHVVEGNHLKPLFTSSAYKRLYDSEWPVVLMHSKEEHKILNSLFRSKGTLEGLQYTGVAPLKGSERSSYISTLYNRYRNIYSGDIILQKVSHNLISSIH